jgi:transcriptional regulator with XRE-family HTH domain
MTKIELGERTTIIREEILNLTQDELAVALGTTQTLVSRMERGMGTIDYLLSLLDFYETKGLKSHMVFSSPFQKELLPQSGNTSNVEQVLHFTQLIKENFNGDFSKLIMLINTL